MSTTKPVDQNSMPQWWTRWFVRNNYGATRYEIGVIDDPVVEFGWETKDIDYHNWTTKKVVDWDVVNVSMKVYEIRPELVEIFNKWLSQVTVYDWVTTESWYSQTIKQWDRWYSADGSKLLILPNVWWVIAPTTVTWSVDWVLTATTDYTTSSFGNDYTIISFVSWWNITTTSQDIVVVYDATPTKWFYEKPNASWLPTWFILESEWEDNSWSWKRIVSIYEDWKPDKPVLTYAGDKDDKWAYIEIKVRAIAVDTKFENL